MAMAAPTMIRAAKTVMITIRWPFAVAADLGRGLAMAGGSLIQPSFVKWIESGAESDTMSI